MSSRPRATPRPAPTRRWAPPPPTPQQEAARLAHAQLHTAYRKLARAEAYAASLTREYAETTSQEHRHTIQIELTTATADLRRARTRYHQAEQAARNATPTHKEHTR